MSYNYQKMRPEVFTESGQVIFLNIRDNAKMHLKKSGAVTLGCLMQGVAGDTWKMLACIDRLVELNELVEIPNPVSSASQHRIFIDGRGC